MSFPASGDLPRPLEASDILDVFAPLIEDFAYGWSIGTFGAVGEFSRGATEMATFGRGDTGAAVVTPRGALRLEPRTPLRPLAYETLTADGEGWNHALALCEPHVGGGDSGIREVGPDAAAIRPQDRGGALFDLGGTDGAVRMCVRTHDASLIAALRTAERGDLLENNALMEQVVRAQPHRVLFSSAGRIEVYQPIPAAGGKSPPGPHTHFLPKLIRKRRTHSANVPVPAGWQPVLTLHPPPPWPAGEAGHRAYDGTADRSFLPFLARFGAAQCRGLQGRIGAAIEADMDPASFDWPETRHGRTAARVALRRLAVLGIEHTGRWRGVLDRGPPEEPQEDGG
jgi:hypothetical protein